MESAKSNTSNPSAIIAQTIKGKGVSFMEDNNAWHKGKLSREQFDIAMRDLEACNV